MGKGSDLMCPHCGIVMELSVLGRLEPGDEFRLAGTKEPEKVFKILESPKGSHGDMVPVLRDGYVVDQMEKSALVVPAKLFGTRQLLLEEKEQDVEPEHLAGEHPPVGSGPVR